MTKIELNNNYWVMRNMPEGSNFSECFLIRVNSAQCCPISQATPYFVEFNDKSTDFHRIVSQHSRAFRSGHVKITVLY